MSTFLGHLGLAIFIGGFFFCAVFAISAARIGSRFSREEEVDAFRHRQPANTN